MYFLMVCHHRENVSALRDALRPRHREWVASGGNGLTKVLTGSALWSESGEGIGNFGILEAPDQEAARSFAKGDPFATGGIVANITLTRLPDGFQADRIDPMTRSNLSSGQGLS